MKKISRKTNLAKLIDKHPKAAEILIKDYGLHCVGCFAAAFETLEQGAKAHGLKNKEIDKMLEKLNKLIK